MKLIALIVVALAFSFVGCGEEEPEHCEEYECTLICIEDDEGDTGHCTVLGDGTSYCWCSWGDD